MTADTYTPATSAGHIVPMMFSVHQDGARAQRAPMPINLSPEEIRALVRDILG